jgi:hypothetical protein
MVGLCSTFLISGVRAQSPGILIGPVGGVNLVSYHTNQFGVLPSDPTIWTVQNGSGVDGFYGLSCLYPLSEWTNQNFIVLEGLYDSKSATFTTTNNFPGTFSAQLDYYLLNVGFKHNFSESPVPKGFGLQVCASIGFKNWANFKKSFNASTIGDTAENPFGESTDISSASDAAALRIAIRAEATYDIPLYSNPGIVLTPAVGFDEPLTKVDSDINWTANSLYFSLSLRFLLFSKPGVTL